VSWARRTRCERQPKRGAALSGVRFGVSPSLEHVVMLATAGHRRDACEVRIQGRGIRSHDELEKLAPPQEVPMRPVENRRARRPTGVA